MSRFDKDSLGNRMKKYEQVYKQQTVPKEPIVIRLDGCHFHSFTKNFKKPFDDVLINTMQRTMLELCKNVQNAVFGYTQSDEITIVTRVDDVIRSEDFYDGKVQKILSVCASKATAYFNKYFYDNVLLLKINNDYFKNVVDIDIYEKKLFIAEFDARLMNIPVWDIYNNLVWRQQDAVRNSIQMLGQAHFSHKELMNKSCENIMDKLVEERNINWNNLETTKKRGSCCYKKEINEERRQWVIDDEMLIFTSDEGKEKYKKIIEQ